MLKKIQEKKAELEKRFEQLTKAKDLKQRELEGLNTELLRMQGAFNQLNELEQSLGTTKK